MCLESEIERTQQLVQYTNTTIYSSLPGTSDAYLASFDSQKHLHEVHVFKFLYCSFLLLVQKQLKLKLNEYLSNHIQETTSINTEGKKK